MKYVPSAVTRTIGRQLLNGKKHSPTILFGAGIVGAVSSVVLACRATLKLDEVLEATQVKTEEAKTVMAAGHPHYGEDELNKDLVYLKVRGAVAICKLYAPAVIIGIASVTMLSGSQLILTRRNAALTAAYAALEHGFSDYRDRVAAKYGKDEETALYHDLEMCEIEIDGEKTLAMKMGSNGSSPYARFFDETSTSWQKNPEYNQFFISAQQNYANDLLRARGHVFLNEVYDMLGITRSKEGAVVGWLRDDTGNGDGYIDFGVFRQGYTYQGQQFVNGNEKSIYLDFNVDGLIYDKL